MVCPKAHQLYWSTQSSASKRRHRFSLEFRRISLTNSIYQDVLPMLYKFRVRDSNLFQGSLKKSLKITSVKTTSKPHMLMDDVLWKLIRYNEIQQLWKCQISILQIKRPIWCNASWHSNPNPDLMPWRITRHSSSGFGTIIVTKEAVWMAEPAWKSLLLWPHCQFTSYTVILSCSTKVVNGIALMTIFQTVHL